MEKKAVKPRFRILSALAIIFVVAGHADFGVFDVAGLFPYYSFHVGVFAFISGYFYKEENENDIKNYIIKKAKHLLLPYYIWNVIYGLFTTLLRNIGFGIGSEITLKTLLLDPFLGGHQYGLNFAAWFVPVLFLIEVMNVLMRKILELFRLKKEWFITGVTLLIGMVVVWLAMRGSVWGYYKHIGCILFLYPIFQAGQFYKKTLECKLEKIPLHGYFAAVLLVQFAILWMTKGRVAYSAVWCTGFLNNPWVPYLTTFTGIAFWLGISRMLEPVWRQGNLLDVIGKNTFSIMMHHVTGFLVLNSIFLGIMYVSAGTFLSDFDRNMYLVSYEYRYLPLGMEFGKWLYLFFGIGVSLLIRKMEQRVLAYIKIRKHDKV